MSKPDPTIKVVIPFRDRGTDLRRGANLEVVMAWWWAHGLDPVVVDDGLNGDAQFNRHRAYNRAVSRNDADVYVFTEADMLIPPQQVLAAARMAARKPMLMVPFTQYRYLSDERTQQVRNRFSDWLPGELADWILREPHKPSSVFGMEAEEVVEGGKSIGAVNVISREALDITGGFTEATHGNWYDDRITEQGFAYLTGNQTQFVPGPVVHLYHLPGWKGDHLTDEDREATERNKRLYRNMIHNIQSGMREPVKALMETRA